jgi:hypothetical protein
MISLTEDQLAFMSQRCQPMQPPEKSTFLHALAELLRQEQAAGRELGDGMVNRAARSLLREFWRPPITEPQAPRLGGNFSRNPREASRLAICAKKTSPRMAPCDPFGTPFPIGHPCCSLLLNLHLVRIVWCRRQNKGVVYIVPLVCRPRGTIGGLLAAANSSHRHPHHLAMV